MGGVLPAAAIAAAACLRHRPGAAPLTIVTSVVPLLQPSYPLPCAALRPLCQQQETRPPGSRMEGLDRDSLLRVLACCAARDVLAMACTCGQVRLCTLVTIADVLRANRCSLPAASTGLSFTSDCHHNLFHTCYSWHVTCETTTSGGSLLCASGVPRSASWPRCHLEGGRPGPSTACALPPTRRRLSTSSRCGQRQAGMPAGHCRH